MTAAEEEPDYPEKVSEYLGRLGLHRLPWGSIVAGGAVTTRETFTARRARAEVAETAISLLVAMGVSVSTLEEITQTLPWNSSAEQLIAKLQEIRSRPCPV